MSKKAEKYLENANEAMGKRNYDKAIKHFKNYIQIVPDDMKAIYTMADAYSLSGDTSKAIELYYGVAEHLKSKGFIMKAIAVCKRILNIDSNNYNAKDLLQTLYKDKSIEDESSGAFKQPSQQAEKPQPAPQEQSVEVDEVSVSGMQAVSDGDNRTSTGSQVAFKETVRMPKASENNPFIPGANDAIMQGAQSFTGDFVTLDGMDDDFEGITKIDALDAVDEHMMAPPEPVKKKERTDTQEIRILQAKDLLFKELSKEEYIKIIDQMDIHVFNAGEEIVKEGDPGDSMYIICSGKVEVLTKDKSGQNVSLAKLGEGDFFGEVSLLTGKPRTATIVALEKMELLELKLQHLPEIENYHPKIRDKLESFYHRRTMHTIETLIDTQNV